MQWLRIFSLTDEDNELLADLLLKWEEAWDLGEDIPAATLCAERPDLVDSLSKQIMILKGLSWMKEETVDEPNCIEAEDAFIGRTLCGRYRIDSLVGAGGHGRVYKAFDPELERFVAVKIARSVTAGNAESLLAEARRVAKLRHPGIVAIYDVGREDGQIFFVSELIEGRNLSELIADGQPLSIETTRIIVALAKAIQFAHEQGFVHRDIKPANILIDLQGRVLVTDFGIATSLELLESQRGGTVGTLPYMAPEQVAGEVQLIGTRTDIHALGVVLYELLTGELPYQGRTPIAIREQILLRPPRPLMGKNNSLPRNLTTVCLKCLAKHPTDRYTSAAEVIEALTAKRSPPRLFGLTAIPLVLVLTFFVLSLSGIFRADQTESTEAVTDREATEFHFDGTSRIITPLKRFAPATLEAWIYPTFTDINCHFVIGSDVRGKYGIGLTICANAVATELVPGILRSDTVVPPGKWSHVAAVFGATETRLYLDGQLVLTGRATESISDETVFVIGNAGENSPIDYFEGRIRSVRITAGERYMSDFVPADMLSITDEYSTAVKLIFEGGQRDGETITDLSGNGNHGRWESFAK